MNIISALAWVREHPGHYIARTPEGLFQVRVASGVTVNPRCPNEFLPDRAITPDYGQPEIAVEHAVNDEKRKSAK